MRSTELRKVLNQSLINPQKPGPFRVVIDVGNPQYWRTKALELIAEANNAYTSSDEADQYIQEAITLLALSRTFHAETLAKTRKAENKA